MCDVALFGTPIINPVQSVQWCWGSSWGFVCAQHDGNLPAVELMWRLKWRKPSSQSFHFSSKINKCVSITEKRISVEKELSKHFWADNAVIILCYSHVCNMQIQHRVDCVFYLCLCMWTWNRRNYVSFLSACVVVVAYRSGPIKGRLFRDYDGFSSGVYARLPHLWIAKNENLVLNQHDIFI